MQPFGKLLPMRCRLLCAVELRASDLNGTLKLGDHCTSHAVDVCEAFHLTAEAERVAERAVALVRCSSCLFILDTQPLPQAPPRSSGE
jgi:hypothetical protein